MKCAAVLNLQEAYLNQTLTTNMIAKTYKKLCLKAHPDKGGDVDAFNKINESYSLLLSIQEEDEQRRNR